jgi:hypothetical protein
MFALLRNRCLVAIAVLTAIGGFAGSVEAGWVTVRNDTNKPIVVQATTTVNGQTRPCKPIRLLPGETVREFHTPGQRTVEVFDGQSPHRSLCSGTITVKHENQIYSVGCEGKAVQITAVAPGGTDRR